MTRIETDHPVLLGKGRFRFSVNGWCPGEVCLNRTAGLWSLVAVFWKVGRNGGLCVWAGTTQLCHLRVCLSCQTIGKVLWFLQFYSVPGWEAWRGVRGPTIVLTRAVPSDKSMLFFPFFFSILPSRKIIQKKAKNPHFLPSSTPCSFTRKKETHRATFIHKVSIHLSLLVVGSGFS